MTVMPRVRRLLPFLLAFVLGVGAAAGLAACGGGSSKALIPATDANALKADLDQVSAAVDNQDCTKADTALAQLQRDIQQLPSTTSARLQRKLTEGYVRLRRQAAKECQADTTTETIPTTTVTTTTAPPVTTTTTATTPTTPATTPTTTTPTTPATTTTTSPDTGGVTPTP